MKSIGKFFGGLVMIACLANGCNDNRTPEQKHQAEAISGIVVDESYIGPRIEGKDKAVFGNETLGVAESVYNFKLQTEKDGVYTINVRDSHIKKESVDFTVNKGTRLWLKGLNTYGDHAHGSIIGVTPQEVVVAK